MVKYGLLNEGRGVTTVKPAWYEAVEGPECGVWGGIFCVHDAVLEYAVLFAISEGGYNQSGEEGEVILSQ